MRKISISPYEIGENCPFTVIAGPCVIESEEFCLETAALLKSIFTKHKIPFIYKSSFDKANRSAGASFRGPGLEEGLRILQKVKETHQVPVVTDIHEAWQAEATAQVCDLLQIPAFLCRQTDLLLAAAKTGKAVNVKKGQFMAPWQMKNVLEKLQKGGCNNILLTERGVSFGYENLVVDMRAIVQMQALGAVVCFDATHSVQLPGGLGDRSGGQREFIDTLALSAVAAGADCLFVEAHPNPQKAKSDSATQLNFEELDALLGRLKRVYEAIRKPL
jgi:2-dehydro-3-deoxyphosphooctonate aldolase (KDO 8-P synthase)